MTITQRPRKIIKLADIDAEEIIIRPVVKFGGCGHITVPKGWIGLEIVVIRPRKIKLTQDGEIVAVRKKPHPR